MKNNKSVFINICIIVFVFFPTLAFSQSDYQKWIWDQQNNFDEFRAVEAIYKESVT